jgi:hypothetical protein
MDEPVFVPDRTGQGLYFDGTRQATHPTAGAMLRASQPDFSIFIRFVADDVSQDGVVFVIGGNGETEDENGLTLFFESSRLIYSTEKGQGINNESDLGEPCVSGEPCDIVLSIEGATGIAYVNGELATVFEADTWTGSASFLSLGSWVTGALGFKGTVGHVEWYDVALEPGQVNAVISASE